MKNPLHDTTTCHRIKAIYQLGPRIVAELLVEVADPIDLDLALDRYGRLDRKTVEAHGTDRFPGPPLTEARR